VRPVLTLRAGVSPMAQYRPSLPPLVENEYHIVVVAGRAKARSRCLVYPQNKVKFR
jgi:hypothetical protein